MKRIIFDISMFLSLFIFPWYVAVILALIGIFIFTQFYEFIGVGIIIYALYTIPGDSLLTSPLWFPVFVSLLYIGIQIARRYIILYKNEI